MMALSRLASLALRANVDIPYRALQTEIAELIGIVVQLERREAKRVVSQVISVERFDTEADCYKINQFGEKAVHE